MPTLLIKYAHYDLRVRQHRGGARGKDGGSYYLIRGRQSVEENETKLNVSDTHGCIGKRHTHLIQLGKLRGHWLQVIKVGLCKLYPKVEYSGTAQSTTIGGAPSVPLGFECGKGDVISNEGVNILFNI